MGLPDTESRGRPPFELADHLPELPPSIENLPDVERRHSAGSHRLATEAPQLDELQPQPQTHPGTRFVNVLDAGRDAGAARRARKILTKRGYTVTLEVPIFDSGAARVKKSEAIYAQSVDRFTQAAIEARSQIRQAYAALPGELRHCEAAAR